MNLRQLVPLALLFALQAGPSPEPGERPSRLRLWLGGGANSLDYAYWGTAGGGCEGPSRRQRYEETQSSGTMGVQVDAWPSSNARISASTGIAGGELAASRTPERFAAGLVAWETPSLGVGAGWSAAPGFAPQLAAGRGFSAYVRLGDLDGAQLRAELRTPTSTPGATGWARAGLAYNQRGRRRGPSIFLGASAVEAGTDTTYASRWEPAARLTRPAIFADITLPRGERLDVFARGHVGKKTRGFGLGVALRFGR